MTFQDANTAQNTKARIQANQESVVSKRALKNRDLNANFSNAELTGEKENAATSAKVNGVKTSIETVQFPDTNSPGWAGAPAIILRHFCGVAT